MALVPPPASKKSKLSGGGEKEGGGENERHKAWSRKSGDNEQEGDDEPDPVDVEKADDGGVSDEEEYESALEDPWPEEVWNDSPPTLTRAPPGAILATEMELGLLNEEENKRLEDNYAAYREKYRLWASGNGQCRAIYRLCARGRQVWRLEGNRAWDLQAIQSWGEFEATEAWQTRVEINEQMMDEAGWFWQTDIQRWVLLCCSKHRVSHILELPPIL